MRTRAQHRLRTASSGAENRRPPAWLLDLDRADPDMPGLGPVARERVQLRRMGVPTPPGFLVAASGWIEAAEASAEPQAAVVRPAIVRIEAATGRRLGGDRKPLFLRVSVEPQGSATGPRRKVVDGIGFSREPAAALVAASPDRRLPMRYFARFLRAYGELALGIAADRFDHQAARVHSSASNDHPAASLEEQLAKRFLWVVQDNPDRPFTYDAYRQLDAVLEALSRLGSGEGMLLVEAAVPEFVSRPSGTCVTRDPATGANRLHGSFRTSATGKAPESQATPTGPWPIERLPEHDLEAHTRLMEMRHALEHGFGEATEFDFVSAFGRTLCTGARPASLTGTAGLVIAADMVRDGWWSVAEALDRITPAEVSEAEAREPGLAKDALAGLLASAPATGVRIVARDSSPEGIVAAASAGASALICPTEPLLRSRDRRQAATGRVAAESESAHAQALSRLLAAHRADLRRVLESAGSTPLWFRLLEHDPDPALHTVQIRAVLEAVAGRAQPTGGGAARILLPGVESAQQVRRLRDLSDRTREQVQVRYGVRLDLGLAVSIESVLACLAVSDLAGDADLLIFDLPRIDHALYGDRAPVHGSPPDGTARLVQHATGWARSVHPEITIGVQADTSRLAQAARLILSIGPGVLIGRSADIGPARVALARAAFGESGSARPP